MIQSFLFYILVVVFRPVLDYVYINFVSPIYTQDFLSLAFNFSIERYVLSLLLYFSTVFVTRPYLKKPSDYFFLLYCLMIIAPLTSIWGLDTERSYEPVLMTVLSFFLISFGLTHLPFLSL